MIKERLTALIPTRRRLSTRFVVVCMVMSCLLLSGFSAWNVVFSAFVQFLPEEAVDLEMIDNFESIIDSAGLETYLESDIIADEIMTGLMANLSGNVYDNIELTEMHDEPLGLKIVKTILDRLFS